MTVSPKRSAAVSDVARVARALLRVLVMIVKATTTDETRTKGKKSDGRRSKRLDAALSRRNEYVTKYYGCVEKVARRLARRLPAHIELGDLISAGTLGLIEAAERFDPARCDRFESFAKMRIR